MRSASVWLSLIVIGSVCGGLLVLTQTFTAAQIQDNRTAQARAIFAQLSDAPLPQDWQPATWGEQEQPRVETLGSCSSWLFSHHQTAGYAGDIAFVALWHAPVRSTGTGSAENRDAKVTLRVTAHRETPGIGDFIDHARSTWLPDQDRSKRATVLAADAVSGATITSNAVRRAQLQIFTDMENYCDRKPD